MEAEKCIICGLKTTEGRQVCRICEKALEPYKEQLTAAYNRTPVEYRGDKYGCISAFIIRFRVGSRIPIKDRCIFQVELMSGRSTSVTIADPTEVKVLKDWRATNE